MTCVISMFGAMLAAVPSFQTMVPAGRDQIGAIKLTVEVLRLARVEEGSQASYGAFSIAGAMPEPASIILVGSVLGLSAVIARRRNSRKR